MLYHALVYRYCGTDIDPGTVFTSSGNEMILIQDSATNWMSGWSADIVFLPGDDCVTDPEPEPTTTDQPTTTAQPTTTPASSSCDLVIMDDTATFTSPNFPEDYPDNAFCAIDNFLVSFLLSHTHIWGALT